MAGRTLLQARRKRKRETEVGGQRTPRVHRALRRTVIGVRASLCNRYRRVLAGISSRTICGPVAGQQHPYDGASARRDKPSSVRTYLRTRPRGKTFAESASSWIIVDHRFALQTQRWFAQRTAFLAERGANLLLPIARARM